MNTYARRIAAGVLAAGLGFALAGTARSQGTMEGSSAPAFQRRPVLEALLQNLGRLAGLRKQLDLKAEQKAELTRILRGHKGEIVSALSKVREGRKKVLAAIRAEKPDESAIRSAVAAMNGPLADAAVLRARIRGEAMAVLTPRQRGQVDALLAQNQASMDEAFAELGGR